MSSNLPTLDDLMELWAQRDRDANKDKEPVEQIPTPVPADEGVPLIHFQDGYDPEDTARPLNMPQDTPVPSVNPAPATTHVKQSHTVFRSYNIGLPTINLSEHR